MQTIKVWAAAFLVERRAGSGETELGRRCILVPADETATERDVLSLVKSWKLDYGVARVFGPYDSITEAEKVADHPELWTLTPWREYVHERGALKS